MVTIILNNHRSRIIGSAKVIHKIHNELKIKAKNYFWSKAWRSRQWDGYVRYVTESGTFMTGLLEQVIEVFKKWKVKFVIEDNRTTFKPIHTITELGDLVLREEYQSGAIKDFLNYKVLGIPFRRGILHEATNAGKNLISAAIVASFHKKRKAIFLINSKTIFNQAVKELGDLLPGEVGQIGEGKEDISKRLTVCMVQTLEKRARKKPKLRNWLNTQIHIAIVDECDEVFPRADCQYILGNCYNASVRLGMSGTPLASKDKNRNEKLLAFFGKVIHHTSNKQLVEWGYSSKPTITFVKGNRTIQVKGDYSEEYNRGIVRNKRRNKAIWKIVSKQIKKGQVVVLVKFHNHIHRLLKLIPDELDGYNIRYIHHKVTNREAIIKSFNKTKVDILISSMIIRRGLNIKLMRTLVNGASGDSEANIVQIFGRGLRKEKGKKEEIDIFDFFDEGAYLKRHSKHRINYYKKEGFEVLEKYK